MITLNASGLCLDSAFSKLLYEAKRWKQKRGLVVLCIQEHNLRAHEESTYKNKAIAAGYTMEISFGSPGDPNSARRGVLMLTADDTVTMKAGGTVSPGLIKKQIAWGDKTLEVACVYAPSEAPARVSFFNDTLSKELTPNTYAGGDWNCVPDVTLDVDSDNPLRYHAQNQGADILESIMSNIGLTDERREQLGMTAEYTHKQKTGPLGNQRVTSTRLDRWHTPTDSSMQCTFEILNEFVYKKKRSDHYAVLLTLTDNDGELGHERTTFREEVMENRRVQAEMKEAADKTWRKHKGRSYMTAWTKMNETIYNILLRETKRTRKGELLQLKRKLAMLTIVKLRQKAKGSTPELMLREDRLTKEVYDLKHPEMERIPTERAASAMTDRSDASTKAMFIPYKERSKKQWIGKVYKEKWEEGKKPVFEAQSEAARTKVSDTKEVGNEFVNLFKMIYAKKEQTERGRQESNKLLRLMAKKQILKLTMESMDGKITEKEVYQVMLRLPTGKQAGPNRIPNAVYKYLAAFFAPKLAQVVNEATRKGPLPRHFLEGDISMLYKKGDRCDPRNYRPITLLNTDYKVFTRVLANRMKEAVHEFVSECQKGFVPDVFIAEATALLKLVEAYTNEDGENRKGILLFLDMEKAFDRVSYDFTLSGLKAFGFGKRFRGWVKMMYDTENAPRRRMYVNGYYSEEFTIRSGVAQGCPLSPLLFLVVAEALRVSVDMEKGLKGINIGKSYFKLSQFADDTTIIMGHKNEIALANKAIQRWCRATSMRENIAKREGLGMGTYRNKDLGGGVKWIMDGHWCKSLGVPIGNDLDEGKWWQGKINSTRGKTALWVGLSRASYFGRNLITQAMYFGRLRYWLYSLRMSDHVMKIVQKDADILWWARDPKLDEEVNPGGAAQWAAGRAPDADTAQINSRRIRRWVAKDTAMGPRNKGGVGIMTWEHHVNAVKAQWIVRYLQPGEAAWKHILDNFVLRNKAGTEVQYPEGRAIVAMNLTQAQKKAILDRMPTKALYWKECLTAFWKLKMVPEHYGWKACANESPWHGYRTEHIRRGLSFKDIQYFKSTLKVLQFADFFNKDNNKRFTRQEWRKFVDRMERAQSGGRRPNDLQAADKGDLIHRISRRIPPEARKEVQKTTMIDTEDDTKIYIERGDTATPAIIDGPAEARLVRIDAVGKHHARMQTVRYRNYTVRKAVTWDDRWAGPHGSVKAWAAQSSFRFLGRDPIWLSELSRSEGDLLETTGISMITRAKAKLRMKKPAAEAVWTARLGQADFSKIWRIRADYVTPRDQVAWLKVLHRNLRVAASGGLGSTTCMARGCDGEENQEHLVDCPVIGAGVWRKIAGFMGSLHMDAGDNKRKWILGTLPNGDTVGREEAAIIFWAWRCLYAEVVAARVDNRELRPGTAYKNTVRMTYTRVKAYGAKWYRWYSRQRYKRDAKRVPRKHREKKLISTE